MLLHNVEIQGFLRIHNFARIYIFQADFVAIDISLVNLRVNSQKKHSLNWLWTFSISKFLQPPLYSTYFTKTTLFNKNYRIQPQVGAIKIYETVLEGKSLHVYYRNIVILLICGSIYHYCCLLIVYCGVFVYNKFA